MMLRGWADDGAGAKDGRALLMSQCVCKGPARDDFHWWTAVPIILLCSQTHTQSTEEKTSGFYVSQRQLPIKPRQLFGNFLISGRFTAPIFRYVFVETHFFLIYIYIYKTMIFHEVALFALFKSF